MSPSPAVALAAPATAMSLVALRGRGAPAETELRPEALAVHNALVERGLETPMVDNDLSAEEKRQRIQAHFTEIMKVLGLD